MSFENRSYKDSTLTDELLERETVLTPDFLELKLQQNIPVFVYDVMKAGGPAFSFVKDGIPLGEAVTAVPNYVMETEDDTGFPVVFELEKPATSGHRVSGEVYLLSAKDILNIDYVNQNTRNFRRVQRFCYLQEQEYPTKKPGTARPSLRCWVYLGVPSFWDKIETSNKKSVEFNYQRVYNWEPPVIQEDLLTPLEAWKPALMEQYDEERYNRLPF